MTVSSSYSHIEFTASVGQTTKSITFEFSVSTDIVVYVDGVVFEDYSISGTTLTFDDALAGGEEVVILRDTSIDQTTDYVPGDRFAAASHENAIDKITHILQDFNEKLRRVPLLPITSTFSSGLDINDVALPSPDSIDLETEDGRAILAWNAGQSNLELIELTTETGLVSSAITSMAFGSLPSVGTTGRLRYVTNGIRGLYADPGTGAWFKVAPYSVNVKEFGAIGDGVNDDTAEIQAAIDACDTNGGGIVFFPTGTYLISSTISIPIEITLRGEGRIGTLINTASSIVMFEFDESLTLASLAFEDLTFSGHRTNTTANIHISGASNVAFNRCDFRSAANGILVEDSFYLSFNDCHFTDHDLFAVKFAEDAVSPVNGWSFRNCDFSTLGTTQDCHILLEGAGYGSIESCNFEGGGFVEYGIQFGADVSNIVIRNNFIELYVGNAIVLNSSGVAGQVEISWNHIQCAQPVTIEFQNAASTTSDIDISYNRFPANFSGGVIFRPGSTARFRFYGNVWQETPNPPVTGYNANLFEISLNTRQHYDSKGQLEQDDQSNIIRYNGSIAVGADANVNLARSTQDFQISSAHATGTITLLSGGTNGIRVDNSATATHTRLLVFDVDNGQLERVTVGAADSGGTGFKVLRIPN